MADLLYLYNVIKIPIILLVIRVIIGCVLIFGYNSITKKIKDMIILLYYGVIIGGMAGYWIKNEIYGIVFGSVMMLLILICIFRYCNLNSFINFILGFNILYTIIETILYIYKIDLSQLTGKYEDLLVNYTNIHVKLLFALIFSVLFILIAIKSKRIYARIENSKIRYVFIGNFFLMGAIFTGTGTPFYMSGEWEDFFVPLLNVNYEPEIFFVPVIEIMIITIFLLKKSIDN